MSHHGSEAVSESGTNVARWPHYDKGNPFRDGAYQRGLPKTHATSSRGSPGTPSPLRRSAPTSSAKRRANMDWTVEKLIHQLSAYRKEMGITYGLLAKYSIETNSVVDRRIHNGKDLFSGVSSPSVPPHKEDTLRIKTKVWTSGKQGGAEREEHFTAARIKTIKKAVPLYYSHPIEIENNVVASQTPMAFFPYKGDTDTAEKQKKQDEYFKELNEVDNHQLGPIKLDQKRGVVINSERVSQVSAYIDAWLDRLDIQGLSKWSLWLNVPLTELHKPRTAEQIEAISARCEDADPDLLIEEAIMFSDAWDQVFSKEWTKHGVHLGKIDLFEVLCRNGEIDAVLNPRLVARKDSPGSSEDKFAAFESKLETYASLGCLICFKHSCEHGFYTDDNSRERFSMEKGVLSRRLAENMKYSSQSSYSDPCSNPCERRCYLDPGNAPSDRDSPSGNWTAAEQQVLRSIFMSVTSSLRKVDPMCHAAALLDRDCVDVREEAQNLSLRATSESTRPVEEARNLKWYNRHTKKLSKRPGEASYHIPNWDHINREMDDVCSLRGCDHDGPCDPSNKDCPCASRGQLCEKFCGCSAETCAYKFTGCSCRLQGKACTVKGEDCICIQLNRECDPDLCGSCGVVERADPVNARNEELHLTGCQNCSLQRGVAKKLVLGNSQFHGFGLFTAEDIKRDQFIIEYVGELVSGEEGDRRYIRRQNVFEDAKPLSFNFTLLKSCVVWVDGARYGNLSRYVNHAVESNSRCNVTPKILLVNGGFRIAFRAKRNIKAWEELLFDYGEDFGIDTDIEKGKKHLQAHKTARKNAPVEVDSLDASVRETTAETEDDASSVDDEGDSVELFPDPSPSPRKRKRGHHEESEEDVYEPPSSNDGGFAGSQDDSETAPRLSSRLRNKARPSPLIHPSPVSRESPPKRPASATIRTGVRGRPKKVPVPLIVPDIVPTPPATKLGSESEEATPRNTKKRRLNHRIEISDSEDDSNRALFIARPQSTNLLARQHSGGLKQKEGIANSATSGLDDANEEPEEEEDADEDEDVEFEEDDEDMEESSPRRDQPVRNRRQPAKFKDDEIYGLRPKKRRRRRKNMQDGE